ncbi:D-ornithine 4,5-aminomutase subunit alpha [Peptococcaceae bacterium CEB3]|nr:D-ornithine 4,5-aminomutase subunit alpha [Peptococcaceae bacterium CEB3]
MGEPRADDFAERRKHLDHLTEEQLEERFWSLANEVVEPLVELARAHTSPSIERSVLLRMGFDSLTARSIVEQAMAHGLLGHGAGHSVWRYARSKGLGIEAAGQALARGEGWDSLKNYFGSSGQ